MPVHQKKRRRGEIAKWVSAHIKRSRYEEFECAYCDTSITWGSEYERRVFREGSTLRIERRHSCPECPDRYPGCGR